MTTTLHVIWKIVIGVLVVMTTVMQLGVFVGTKVDFFSLTELQALDMELNFDALGYAMSHSQDEATDDDFEIINNNNHDNNNDEKKQDFRDNSFYQADYKKNDNARASGKFIRRKHYHHHHPHQNKTTSQLLLKGYLKEQQRLQEQQVVEYPLQDYRPKRKHRDKSSQFSTPQQPQSLPSNHSQFQLTVPFYIYDVPLLNWTNITERLANGTYTREALEKLWKNYKHADDYWFLQHAHHHPSRTTNASQAKLFLVSTLLNSVGIAKVRKTNICLWHHGENKYVCGDRLVDWTARTLAQQSWFQRFKGQDHIVVDSHWHKITPMGSSLFHCHQVVFEDRYIGRFEQIKRPTGFDKAHRIGIPSMYIGTACPTTDDTTTADSINNNSNNNKLADFAFVASMHPELPLFQARTQLCGWLQDGNFSMTNCGPGKQCPALAQARFGFHVRGDTLGSNRLIDTLLSHTIPIYTDVGQFDILPPMIPWKKLGYLVEIKPPKQKFQRELRNLLDYVTDQVYQEKMELIQQYLPLLDHTLPYQFDAYMAHFAQRLGLQ